MPSSSLTIPVSFPDFVQNQKKPSDTKGLEKHEVSYLPLDAPHQATVATLTSSNGVNALTIIGNKDGTTPFDVRQIFVFVSSTETTIEPHNL